MRLEGALDWMRNHAVEPISDTPIPNFESLGIVHINRMSPDDRKRENDNILNWIRSGKPHVEDSNEIYCNIDQILPVEKGKTP